MIIASLLLKLLLRGPVVILSEILVREIIKKITSISTSTKRLVIIGPKGSGKTTIWRSILESHPEVLEKLGDGGTSITQIPDFTIRYNGRDLQIIDSKDIGGGDDFFANRVVEELKKDDTFILFIFNANNVLQEIDSEIKVIQERLEFIHRMGKFKDHSINGKMLLIGSHIDEALKRDKELSEKNIPDKLYQKVGTKYFKQIQGFNIEKHLIAIDLTNKNMLNNLKNKLFENEK